MGPGLHYQSAKTANHLSSRAKEHLMPEFGFFGKYFEDPE